MTDDQQPDAAGGGRAPLDLQPVDTGPLPMEATLRSWEREVAYYESQSGEWVAELMARTLRACVEQMRRSWLAEVTAQRAAPPPAYEQALRSIANSACCGGCQEAALVARAALRAAPQPEKDNQR